MSEEPKKYNLVTKEFQIKTDEGSNLIHYFKPTDDYTVSVHTGTTWQMYEVFVLEIEKYADIDFSCLKLVNPSLGLTWKYMELLSGSMKKYLELIQEKSK